MKAKATFALKAELWVLRVRLGMGCLSPGYLEQNKVVTLHLKSWKTLSCQPPDQLETLAPENSNSLQDTL